MRPTHLAEHTAVAAHGLPQTASHRPRWMVGADASAVDKGDSLGIECSVDPGHLNHDGCAGAAYHLERS